MTRAKELDADGPRRRITRLPDQFAADRLVVRTGLRRARDRAVADADRALGRRAPQGEFGVIRLVGDGDRRLVKADQPDVRREMRERVGTVDGRKLVDMGDLQVIGTRSRGQDGDDRDVGRDLLHLRIVQGEPRRADALGELERVILPDGRRELEPVGLIRVRAFGPQRPADRLLGRGDVQRHGSARHVVTGVERILVKTGHRLGHATAEHHRNRTRRREVRDPREDDRHPVGTGDGQPKRIVRLV